MESNWKPYIKKAVIISMPFLFYPLLFVPALLISVVLIRRLNALSEKSKQKYRSLLFLYQTYINLLMAKPMTEAIPGFKGWIEKGRNPESFFSTLDGDVGKCLWRFYHTGSLQDIEKMIEKIEKDVEVKMEEYKNKLILYALLYTSITCIFPMIILLFSTLSSVFLPTLLSPSLIPLFLLSLIPYIALIFQQIIWAVRPYE